MDILLLSVLILIVSRLYLVKVCGQSSLYSDGDIAVHLGFVKEYIRTAGGPIRFNWRYTLEHDDYPTGYHKIFYYFGFSCEWLAKYGGIFNIIFDTCHLVLIYYFLKCFQVDTVWILLYPISRFLISHEGRAATFNERSFGVFFGSLYLVCSFVFCETGDYLFLVLAAFSFLVFSISSKFAWQAVTFVMIFMCFALQSVMPIAVYCTSFIFSVFLSRGYALDVLKGLIRHSKFYESYLASRHYGLENNYKKIREISSFQSFIYEILNNRVFRSITDYPVMSFCIFILFSSSNYNLGHALVLFLLVIHLVFCTETFKFLGEAERYIEFCLPFVFLFVAKSSSAFNLTAVALIVAVYVVLFGFRYLKIVRDCRDTKARDDEYRAVVSYMSDIKQGLAVAVPFRLAYVVGLNLPAENKIQFLMNYTNAPLGQNLETLKGIMPDHYPFIDKDTDSIIRKFSIDFLLVDKQAVNFLHAKTGGYYQRFNKYPIVFETATLMVIDLTKWVCRGK